MHIDKLVIHTLIDFCRFSSSCFVVLFSPLCFCCLGVKIDIEFIQNCPRNPTTNRETDRQLEERTDRQTRINTFSAEAITDVRS